ncbi:MAG: AP2 domain-containing protein [Verrucomicrobiota bacterium]
MKKIKANYGLNFLKGRDGKNMAILVKLRRQGEVHQKYFGYKTYGSAKASKDAAVKYRDAVMKKHPEMSRRDYAEIKKSNNKSGIPGVCRTFHTVKGISYPVWQAAWSPAPGKRRCKKFFVSTHGERKAKKLAIEARHKALTKM